MTMAGVFSMRKPTQTGIMMEGRSHKQNEVPQKFFDLLVLAAMNDLNGFRTAIEEEGRGIDEPSLWYGRILDSKKMGFQERTPLLISSIFGSKDVLSYIIKSGRVDVNRACGSDGARALHCAAAGGSSHSPEIVKLLLDASADTNSLDANGNRPADLIAPACSNSDFNYRKMVLEALLNGCGTVLEQPTDLVTRVWKDGNEKKEYPYDVALPDIKNGIYGTDEFRMYTFKVQPCSRAYSHDWTECPFVHPGENARRRDPRKYLYSCVPCPEFRKGSCKQGDNCEYAHGIFESWLHPAQYRTRLCKDETNCTRRVCFFAHKPEELRPLYASTGSAVPSPRSYDFGSMSPLAPASPSVIKPSTSTPPVTPNGTSPMGGSTWPNQSSIAPPTLQLPTSRLKAARSARGKDLNMEKLSLESHRRLHEMSSLPSPTGWNNPLSASSAYSASGDRAGELNRFGGAKTTNLEDIFGSLDIQGISLEATSPQMQSPTGVPMRQNISQQLRGSYPTNLASSPVMLSPSFGVETSVPTSTSLLSSKRPSAIERPNRPAGFSTPASPVGAMPPNLGYSTPASPVGALPPNLSDWSSPDGKLDWGIQGEELKKLRKSASLVFLSNGSNFANGGHSMSSGNEPDASRVPSHMNGALSARQLRPEDQLQQQCHDTGSSDMLIAWMEQMYKDQE